ncbi:hypothetical protein V1264_015700 [Littorina saxatilis]
MQLGDCEMNLHSPQPKSCGGREINLSRENPTVGVQVVVQTYVFYSDPLSISPEENNTEQLTHLDDDGRERPKVDVKKSKRNTRGYSSSVTMNATCSVISLGPNGTKQIDFTVQSQRRHFHMERRQHGAYKQQENEGNPRVQATNSRETRDSIFKKSMEFESDKYAPSKITGTTTLANMVTGDGQKGHHYQGEKSLCDQKGNATQSATIDQTGHREKVHMSHYTKSAYIPVDEQRFTSGMFQIEREKDSATNMAASQTESSNPVCGLKEDESKLYLDNCTVPDHDSDEGTLCTRHNDSYQHEIDTFSLKPNIKSYNQQNQTGFDHNVCMLTVCLTIMVFDSEEMKQKLRPLFQAFPQAKSIQSLIHMLLQRTCAANNLTNLSVAEDLDHKDLKDAHGCDKGKIPNIHDAGLSHNHRSKSTQEPRKPHQRHSESGDQKSGKSLKSPRMTLTGLSQYFRSYVPRFPTVYTVFPSSFLPSMGASATDSLAHLGSRLASLSSLPASCDISRVRLAEAGFYYDNSKTARDASNVHEVVCYSCGLTYGQWKKGDNPTTVHVSLRPDCEYLKSKNAQNSTPGRASSQPASANAPSLVSDGSSSLASSGGYVSDQSSSIISSGHGSIVRGSSLQQSSVYSTDSGIGSGSFNSRSDMSRNGGDLATDCSSIPPTRPLNQSASSGLARDSAASSRVDYPNSYSASRDTSRARALDLDDRPPLDMNSAVYPQFCRHQERRATFSTWPLSDLFRPDDLVMQGFYYAGYADCLRCFYCGVGLKSWAEDDDVMVEHIRWRPSCGYVLNTKGRQFVDSVLNSLGNSNSNGEQNNGSSRDLENRTPQPNPAPISTSPSTNAPPTQNTTTEAPTTVRSVNGSASANATASSVSATASQLSAAATPSGGNASREVLKKVEDMGFSKNKIARAVRHFQQAGMTKISAEALVEKIIELDLDNSSDATATNSAQRDGLQTDGPEGASNYDLDADIQRAQRIISENERLKTRQKCKICKQAQVGMIFLPCGHILACTQCGPKTKNCTHCGEVIRATANVYLS